MDKQITIGATDITPEYIVIHSRKSNKENKADNATENNNTKGCGDECKTDDEEVKRDENGRIIIKARSAHETQRDEGVGFFRISSRKKMASQSKDEAVYAEDYGEFVRREEDDDSTIDWGDPKPKLFRDVDEGDRKNTKDKKEKKDKKDKKRKKDKKVKKAKDKPSNDSLEPAEDIQETTEKLERHMLDELKNKKLGERNINLSSLLAMVTVNDSGLCVDSDDIYVYDEAEGCYKKQSKSDIQTLIAGKVTYGQRLKLSSKDISDAAKLLTTVPEIKGNINNDHPTLVNCRNGVFDITKGKLKKHSPKYKFGRCIQANYDPDAKGKVFQRFINEACGGDKKLICLVQEVLGYAFSYSSDVKSAVIFYGPHNTGKSTILSMITNMWGTENVSNVNIQDYNTSCFAAQIMDKAINIAPDLPSDEIKDISVFKSMVSAGDSITTKKLYSNPKSAPCKAKHYFGANQFIALSKKLTAQNLEALFSRLVFVPFEHQRSAETMNHRLIEELKEESDFIFTWSMEGLMRLKKNNWEFSKYRRSEELLDEYRCQYSPEASFFNKYLEKDKDGLLLTSKVQERYAEYAVLNGVCCGTHDMINYIKAVHPDIPRKKKRCGDKNPRSVYVGLRFKDDIEF